MRKLPTGEPYAGKLHVRFGGRGGREPFSTPIRKFAIAVVSNNFAAWSSAGYPPAASMTSVWMADPSHVDNRVTFYKCVVGFVSFVGKLWKVNASSSLLCFCAVDQRRVSRAKCCAVLRLCTPKFGSNYSVKSPLNRGYRPFLSKSDYWHKLPCSPYGSVISA